ncbi:MAG: cysteine desulfurase [Acidimicrobiales bacterium]|jgi:cysteine desulfurase|nr:cysteine desulfurase [Acidimicrobiales bacterium]
MSADASRSSADPPVTYLDHAATTPMRPEAVEAMLPFLTERYANPSGAHRMARDANRALDDARDQFAAALGCTPGEVVFTSGGTESDNLAVFGARRRSGEVGPDGLAVCSAIEHHAVLDAVAALGGRTVDVDRTGTVDLAALAEELDAAAARHRAGTGPAVRLVSVMAVNNEVGTVQPLPEVAEVVRRHAPDALLHTDAVQGFCALDVAAVASVADLVTVSAHKFGGPKGIGVLVVRPGVELTARQVGGGQERGHRPGTPDVAGIVAAGVAARATVADRTAEVDRLAELRDRLVEGLLASVPDVVETGVPTSDGAPDRSGRAPGIAHVCIGGVESESLIFLLERAGVFASAASSCSSGAAQPSHVLAAMGVEPRAAGGALRLSLGWSSTEADVDHALAAVPAAVEQLRRFAL